MFCNLDDLLLKKNIQYFTHFWKHYNNSALSILTVTKNPIHITQVLEIKNFQRKAITNISLIRFITIIHTSHYSIILFINKKHKKLFNNKFQRTNYHYLWNIILAEMEYNEDQKENIFEHRRTALCQWIWKENLKKDDIFCLYLNKMSIYVKENYFANLNMFAMIFSDCITNKMKVKFRLYRI